MTFIFEQQINKEENCSITVLLLNICSIIYEH